MMEALARTIVARYCLVPGETITRVAMSGRAVAVTTTRTRWAVEPDTALPQLDGSGELRLFDVTEATLSHPRPPRGVCVGTDGALWLLSNPHDLQRWYELVATILAPLELARLLVRYHAEGSAGHTLVEQMDDLGEVLPSSSVAALPGFTLPSIHAPRSGALEMTFCSLFLARGEQDRVWRVNLDRWKVIAAPGVSLTWSVTPIARNLDSPQYSSRSPATE